MPPGPACLSCSAASPTPHRSPLLRNRAVAHARWPGAVPSRVLCPALPTAMPRALSLSFPFLHVATSRPPPPISLSHSPPHVRGFEQAAGASLRSVSCPCPISSSPHSPPPTQPPHRLLPLETPPPLWFLPEHHRRPPLSVSTTA
jgi:hypothetical protein